MKQYEELKQIAKRIEEIRVELFNSKEHKENMFWKDEFEEVNNKLFTIQSKLNNLNEFINDCI